MLATPGCWAWDEMGALLAGVFCGVLDIKVWLVCLVCTAMRRVTEVSTYGAVTSGRRFLMGSAIVSVLDHRLVETMGCESVGREMVKKKSGGEKGQG